MKPLLIAAAAAFALAAPLASHADPGHDKGHKGHAAKHGDASTPRGLAKTPHGMPPGQAKKMWRQGERLPPIYVVDRYAVAYPGQHQLAPAPYGYRWVQVDGQFYLAQTQTGLIAQVVSALVR